MTETTYRLTKVAIEDSEALDAYVVNRSWNGWAMPAFTRDQGNRWIEWQNKAQAGAARFDATRDAFVSRFAGEEEEVWPGIDVLIDGKSEHVYGIGAGVWVWFEDAN
jgi:hypothetical protein